MTGNSPATQTLSAEKRALQARRLRQDPQVRALLMSEPLAIIGMGCRFPGGVNAPDALWRLLLDGTDAIGPAPPGRWFDTAERPLGGYAGDLDGVDLAYFGLTEHYAARIDPQQRLFLETAIEALDDAGLTRSMLAGSRTGVFVGACVSDYARKALEPGLPADGNAVSGIADAILANRLSYMLDLSGPSLAIDTACSSSLVALHLACQSLRTGESDITVTGGVNALLAPDIGRALTRAGMLAPNGRCKTFDARADGFVRGEGAGALVIRRLADAIAAGDRVHAVIRGTAVNQDGRSNGLTAPNPLAQERVMRAALANAGVAPRLVGYVEAHGTGTALGDPIEVQALGAVYAEPDRPEPLRIGAVKASIGHLEGAAGVASMIKTVLCMKYGRIPRQIHFTRPNPAFGDDFALHIPTTAEPWAVGIDGNRRFAGVSAFGFGGTNAHVVLEETPPGLDRTVQKQGAGPMLLAVTAADPMALARRAEQAASVIESGADLADLQFTLARRSSHLPYRLAATGTGRDNLAAALRNTASPDTQASAERSVGAGAVFVFSGQGNQWLGMARSLLTVPAFRTPLERCDEALRGAAGWSLMDVLDYRDPAQDITAPEVAQPILTGVQVALAALLQHLGIRPAAMIGHSAGEIAAAVVSGSLTVRQGMTVAAERGRLMAPLSGQGAMAAVEASAAAVLPALAGLEVDVAAVNAPASVVLSGRPDDLDEALRRLGLPSRRLPGTCAFHGRQTAAAAAALAWALADLAPAEPELLLMSSVTAGSAPRLDGAYWACNVRQPVLFAAAAAQLMDAGHDIFIEIGPHPSLLSPLRQCWAARGGDLNDIAVLPTLRRATDDWLSLLRTIGGLFVRGIEPDWTALGNDTGRVVPLPPYPWQRTRCWLPVPTLDTPATETGAVALHAVEFQAESAARPSGLPDGPWDVIGEASGAIRHALARASHALPASVPVLRRRLLVFEDAGGDASAAVDACDRCLDLVRDASGAALWLITRDPVADAVAASLWGLAEGVGRELPGRIGAVIGIASLSNPDGIARQILTEIGRAETAEPAGPRVVLDGEQRRVPVLRQIDAGPPGKTPIDPADAYLVTGGLGGIGLACAQWLANQGVRHLVLAGRRPPSSAAQPVLDSLRRRGLTVELVAADIGDPNAVADLLDGFGKHRPRLRGIVHAAGVLRDSLLRDQSRAALSEIFAAKVAGADTLIRLTAGQGLGFVVLMSSIAGLFGALGQAGYGAANAYLDALARRARASGENVTSIVWGPWRDTGMAARLGTTAAADRNGQGIGALSTSEALAALERAMLGTYPVVAATRMDWPRFAASLPAGCSHLARTALPPAPRARAMERTSAAAPVSASMIAELSLLPPLARRGRLRQLIAGTWEAVTGSSCPDSNRGFFDQGMDSLMAADFRKRLNAALGGGVSPTTLFEHATIVALSDHLLSVLAFGAGPVREPVRSGSSRDAAARPVGARVAVAAGKS
jgi:acyl transferase domain-containing protein/NAD(P)-dependent dehydrogenase (short-subunit alcohol dehydrogenase family)